MRLNERRSVVLPQPDGPISDVMIPRRMLTVMFRRAWNEPYQRLTSRVWMLKRSSRPTADSAVGAVSGVAVAGVGAMPAREAPPAVGVAGGVVPAVVVVSAVIQ